MTLELYGFPMSPNSRRAQMALEEVGAAYRYVAVDLMQGEHKKPGYLAINPNGKVPTLVDDDLILWESHAILEYLAEKFPAARLGGADAKEKGLIAQWTYLNASHFGAAVASVFAHTIRLPEDQRVELIAKNGRAEAERILKVLDAGLAGKTYLVAERFTLADLAFAPTLVALPMLGFDLTPHANVSAWNARIRERPSFKKVVG